MAYKTFIVDIVATNLSDSSESSFRHCGKMTVVKVNGCFRWHHDNKQGTEDTEADAIKAALASYLNR